MKKLLVLCPSRGRAKRIQSMIESFEKTVDPGHTDLMILLDHDDPQLREYFELEGRIHIKVYDRTGDKTYTTEILNRAFQETDYPYYSVTNDDIHYLTPGWDKKLCNLGKISTGIEDNMIKKYGRDWVGPISPVGFPISSVIDARIARSVGWIQLPTLKHSAGDNIWYWLGRGLKILDIHEDIHYVHRSAYFDDGEKDETYTRTNAYTNHSDYLIYMDWLKYKREEDMNKIKECLV